jgi:hypothetical protein
VRNKVAAEAVFSQGVLAIGSRPVPTEALTALRIAARDTNPRVGVEALYAFGTLAVEPGGVRRRELLRTAGPELISLLGVADPALRYAAVRVIGRVFERRAPDDPIDTRSATRLSPCSTTATATSAAPRCRRWRDGAMSDRAGPHRAVPVFGRGGLAEEALERSRESRTLPACRF